MFKSLIKNSSKFLAVLLTAVLAFSPLSYAEDTVSVTTWDDLASGIQSLEITSIEIGDNIPAGSTATSLGEQGSNTLTINGGNKIVDGNDSASGFSVGKNKENKINNITFEHFKVNEGFGGVIFNEGQIEIISAKFSSNTAEGTYAGMGSTGLGGAIFIDTDRDDDGHVTASLKDTGSTFEYNKATAAGAIFANGSLTLTNTKFIGNEAAHFGAIAVVGGDDDITSLTGVEFTGNISNGTTEGMPGAGALYLGSETNPQIKYSKFESNISAKNGGAINSDPLPNEDGKKPNFQDAGLDISNSTFTANKAGYDYTGETVVDSKAKGGAINNYYYNSKAKNDYVYVANSYFNNNKAGFGGAIYNNNAEEGEGKDGRDGAMWIENSTFAENIAAKNGGAIYNHGKMVINGSSFTANKANGSFQEGAGFGGAIDSDGALTITSSYFGNNEGSVSGAIMSTAGLDVTDSTFYNNKSLIGAVGIFGSEDDKTKFSNVIFENNESTGYAGDNMPSAGALAFGQEVNVTINNNTEFNNNMSAGHGGAIGSQPMGLNDEEEIGKDAKKASEKGGTYTYYALSKSKLDITGATFNGNKTAEYNNGEPKIEEGKIVINDAGKGGAIDNYFYGSNEKGTDFDNASTITKTVDYDGQTYNYEQIDLFAGTDETKAGYVFIKDSNFTANQAGFGGAIYNHGNVDGISEGRMWIENVIFENNIATVTGGAIYNEGTIVLSSVTFNDNKANGIANDIYNTGTLRFTSGTITMTGGIIGEGTVTVGTEKGSNAQLVLEENAVLQQKSLTIMNNAELSAYIDNMFDDQNDNDNLIITDTILNNGILTLNLKDETQTLKVSEIKNKINYNTEESTGQIQSNANLEIDAGNVTQSTVTIADNKNISITEGATLETYSVEGGENSEILVAENSKLTLDLQEDSKYDLAKLSGAGKFEVNASTPSISTVTLNLAGKNIEISTITATGDKHLVFDGTGEETAQINSDIINNMSGHSLELKNVTLNKNLYNYPGSTDPDVDPQDAVLDISENVVINGTIENSTGTIYILKDFNVQNTIYGQENDIAKNKIYVGTTESYAAVNSTATIKYQTITVSSGSLTLVDLATVATGGKIENSSVNIEESGALTANASRITNTPITNNGNVTFTGGENNNIIDGAGSLTVTNDLTNNAAITQNTITIESGEFIHNVGAAFPPGEDHAIIKSTNIYVNAGSTFTAHSEVSLDNYVKLENNGLVKIELGGEAPEEDNINNDGVITGSGELQISGAGFRNRNAITQSTITVSSGAIFTSTLTANEEQMLTADTIQNAGTVNFYGGTNNSEITGVTTATSANPVYGEVEIRGNVVNEAKITQNKLSVVEGASFETNVNNVTVSNGIKNVGTFTLTGEGTNSSNIDGITGGDITYYGETIFAKGSNVTNSATITQSTITVSGTVINSDADPVATVSSAGQLNQTGTAGKIAITETGKLTTNANNIFAANGITIADGGTLEFTGGEINDTININDYNDNKVFTGTLNITRDVTNSGGNNRKTIYVSTVTISESAKLINGSGNTNTIEANYVTGGSLENNSIFELALLNSEGYNLTSLTGSGQFDVYNNVQTSSMNISGKNITQDYINFYGGQTLIIDGTDENSADTVATITAGTINNYVTGDSLHVINTRLDSEFVNNQDGHAVFENGSSVSGKIYNNGGTIDILSNDFTIQNGITGATASVVDNKLNIGSATAAGNVTSSHTIAYQNITVSSGSLAMVVGENNAGIPSEYGTIDKSLIKIEEKGTLKVNAESVTNLRNSDGSEQSDDSNDAAIINDGTLIFVGNSPTGGASENENEIKNSTNSSKGNLIIDGDVTNYVGTKITQNLITINSGKQFTASADDINAPITNAGTYNVIGGTISYTIAGTTVQEDTTGDAISVGTVNINTAEVTLDSTISGSTVNVENVELKIANETYIDDTSTLIIKDGAIINTQNNATGTLAPAAIIVEDDAQWNYKLDVDLGANEGDATSADKLTNITVGTASKATIDNINLIRDINDTYHDYAEDAELKIADRNINLQIGDPLSIVTTSKIYNVYSDVRADGTYLIFTTSNLGGLPVAVNEAASSYSLTKATDYVDAWIVDASQQQNFLKTNLTINGNNRVLTSTTGVDGLRTSSNTLTINNLAEMSGFKNSAITVDYDDINPLTGMPNNTGRLNLSNVTFSSNSSNGLGGAITNYGTVSAENVTFSSNSAISGGALFNYVTGQAEIKENANFENNTAATGGAIANLSEVDLINGIVNISSGATFSKNKAIAEKGISNAGDNVIYVFENAGQGGAIYNEGVVNISSGVTFTENVAISTTIAGFINSTSTVSTITFAGTGGAIYNAGEVVIGEYSKFEGNNAQTSFDSSLGWGDLVGGLLGGGAIYNSLNFVAIDSTTEPYIKVSTVTIGDNAEFTSNTADGFGGAVLNIGKMEIGENTKFIGNEAKYIDTGSIYNDIPGFGGAIANMSIVDVQGDIVAGSITIGNNAEFTSNTADVGGAIYNEGVINFEGNTTFSGNSIGSEENLTLNDIHNIGALNFNGGIVTMTGGITSNLDDSTPGTVPVYLGTTTISGASLALGDDATLQQYSLVLTDNSELSVNVEKLAISDTIYNNGNLIFSTGTATLANNITGAAGTTTISGATVTLDGTTLKQQSLVIGENGSFTTALPSEGATTSNFEIGSKKIQNDGILTFTGSGTVINENDIVDTDDDVLKGSLQFGTQAAPISVKNTGKILQNNVNINGQLINVAGSTITVNSISGSTLQNNGLFVLNLENSQDYGLESLTYDNSATSGETVAVSSITVNANDVEIDLSNKTIEQKTIYTYGDKSLTLSGGTVNSNFVNYMTGNCLDIATIVDGNLDNNFDSLVDDAVVNILAGGSVTGAITNSSGTINILRDYNIANGITGNSGSVSNNIVNIGSYTATSSTAAAVTSSTTIAYQTINVSSGSLTMYAEVGADKVYGIIDNSAINVEENGELTVHASSMTNIVNKTVTNDGKVILIGNATATDNENAFVNTASGKGNLVIDGNINNKEGVSITQSSVTVLATSTLTANASDITGGTTFNAGQLIFKSTNNMTNDNVITGIEDTYGNLTVESTLQNNANITQDNIDITGGTTTNNADLTMTTQHVFTVESGATLVNGGTVNAKEMFINFGTTTNSGTITSNDRVINDFEDNLTNSGDIVSPYFQNAGYTENSGTITASDSLNNLKEFKNLSGGSINAKKIINKSSGTITNFDGGTITAGTIDNYVDKSVYNYAGGVIESTKIINSGVFETTGTITAGTIENDVVATLNNYEGGVIESTSIVNKGIINTTGTITASEITNISGATITNFDGGTIKGENDGIAQITNEGTLTSNADGIIATVFNTGTYNVTGGTVSYNVTGATGGTVNIATDDVTVSTDVYISQNEVHVSKGLKLWDETALKTSTLIIEDGAIINTINGKTADIDADKVTINGDWTYRLDVDLQKQEGDKLINIDTVGLSTATIDEIQLLSDKASGAKIQIADADINAQIAGSDDLITDKLNIYTSKIKYAITVSTDEAGTYLNIAADGYGGLPVAVYEKAAVYDVTVDENDKDVVAKWITNYEEDGVTISTFNFLRNNLTIRGHGKQLVAEPEAPETELEGLRTGGYTLNISSLAAFSGFKNALTVEKVITTTTTAEGEEITTTEYGSLNAKDIVFSSNTGTAIIAAASSTTVVLSGVTFDETNTADIDVANDGDLLLIGDPTVFNKGISGAGTTTIRGVAIDLSTPTASLEQARVEISDVVGSSLTARVAGTNVGLFMNNGQLVLLSSAASVDAADTLNSEINGIGVTTISGGAVNVTNNITQSTITLTNTAVMVSTETDAKVKATNIIVDEYSQLTANASNIDTFAAGGKIANAGTVEFINGTNSNTIDGNGQLIISGAVINSTGAAITQSSITVASGSFETSASDITTTNGILNEAELTLTGGTLIAANTITGSGNLTITDNLTNLATIQQDGEVSITKGLFDNRNETDGSITAGSISVASGAGLKTKANSLASDKGIANEGDITLTGGVLGSSNTITEAGNVIITDSLELNANISQTQVAITSGTTTNNAEITTTGAIIIGEGGKIETAAKNLTATGGIDNDGEIIFNSALTDDTNGNEIKGMGALTISSNTTVTNSADIMLGGKMTIDSGSKFVTDANNLGIANAVENEGILEYVGGTNNNDIKGAGQLIISNSAVVNSLGAKITQSSITVASGSFETSANDITTTDGILNEAELTLTGGTLIAANTITGNGNLTVTGDLQNNAAISQSSITVTSNYFDNVSGSSITAKELVATTRFMTDAADLNISDSIELTTADSMLKFRDTAATVSTITANITGNGYLVQAGSATVVLSGTNNYAGTTTISAGALQISSNTNISENTIYADGGKLIINATEAEVELGNKIVGTYGENINDVKLEVVAGTATLNDSSIIYGNGNLEKTGEGTLNLLMTENEYIGDTIISSGTVIGTTKNIKGKVIGSGDATSAVEFYDADGEVILNEIDTEKYIGTFTKTGASTMTVTNAFRAQTANISNGVFVINNDSEMGGSGNTFKVEDTMTVANSLLKGYGNIEVGKLIISSGATFAPGNSTTTFKVKGDMEIQENGTLDMEFSQLDIDKANEEETNDKVSEVKNATIDSKSNLVLNNTLGKYYLPETFVLVDAETMNEFEYDNGTGEEQTEDKGDYKEITLGNVTLKDFDAAGLRTGYDTRISTRVYVEGGKLKVELQRKASDYGTTKEFDRSHNEQEAATAIDAVSTGNGGDITLPLDIMEHFFYYEDPETGEANIPALKAALNDVAGVIHANATNLTFFNAKAEHVYDKIKERTLDLFPCTKFHNKIWAEYYYNNYNVDKDDNSPKYDTNVNGFLVGFDAISAKGWTLGVMAGYGTSELKQVSDKATMSDINAGLYGGYEGSKWSFKSMLLGGYESYDITRQIAFMERRATSEHKGYSGALDAELGYKISLNKEGSNAKHKMYLRPFIGAIGSYMNNEGYQEKGAEDLNLKIQGYDAFSAEARAGVGINGKVKKFGWYAKAGARQLLTDKYNEVETSLLNFSDSTKMKIRSAENSQTTLTGGIGADYQLSDAWTVFANGLGNFADKSTNYYANIGLAYKFGCVNNKPKADTSDKDVERLSELLNTEMEKDSLLKKQLDEKDKELEAKRKELEDAKAREKELQDRIQKYEANIVTESKAEQLKEKTLKQIKLKNKPTFVFGTAKLTNKGKAALAQVVEELKQYPEDSELLVEGYTDNVGPDEVNQKLSEDRASTIATTLKKDYNVKNNINVIGKGEKDPIVSNDTEAGRATNRRVEIIITAPVDDEGPADGEEIVNENVNNETNASEQQ